MTSQSPAAPENQLSGSVFPYWTVNPAVNLSRAIATVSQGTDTEPSEAAAA